MCSGIEQRDGRFRTCLCVTRCTSAGENSVPAAAAAGKSSSSAVVTKRVRIFPFVSSLERVGVGRKRKIREEGWSEKLEEDGFNVCASAVLAEESRKDECFVLLSLKSRKKCVQPGHCASVPKVSLAKKCVQSRRAVRTEWVREELCIISKKRS